MPLLKAKFGITSITIEMALHSGGLLPDKMRKKWFDKALSKTTVLVQFTKLSPSNGNASHEAKQDSIADEDDGGGEDFESLDVINIRKFASVKAFMASAHTLDNVLLNIESFNKECRGLL